MTTEPMHASDPIALSAAGQARRVEMLRHLNAAMRRRSIRRTTVRAAAIAAPLFLLAGVAWIVAPASRPTPLVPGPAHTIDTAPTATESRVTWVATDPDIVRRLSPSPSQSLTQMVSDEDLRSLLAASGHDPTFVRTGNRVILASDIHPWVSDEPPPEDDVQG